MCFFSQIKVFWIQPSYYLYTFNLLCFCHLQFIVPMSVIIFQYNEFLHLTMTNEWSHHCKCFLLYCNKSTGINVWQYTCHISLVQGVHNCVWICCDRLQLPNPITYFSHSLISFILVNVHLCSMCCAKIIYKSYKSRSGFMFFIKEKNLTF